MDRAPAIAKIQAFSLLNTAADAPGAGEEARMHVAALPGHSAYNS
jgi:hypothetical protein